MSERTPRIFTTEFKERAVLRLEAGEPATPLAAELGVRRKLLYDWTKAYREQGVAGLYGRSRRGRGLRRVLAPRDDQNARVIPRSADTRL